MLNSLKIVSLISAFFISNLAWAEETSADWGERLRFFRWLENYDDFKANQGETFATLKRIALTDSRAAYLTIGGDYRARYEHYSNQMFALVSDDSSNSRLQRFMLHADLHLESSRLFVQLAQYTEDGLTHGPRPLDESALDIQQAFYETKTDWGKIKLGRQEFILGSGKKTGVREGPNQRRAFDGINVTIKGASKSTFDIFYMQEVQAQKESFKDSSSSDRRLYGVHANAFVTWDNDVSMDLFYYGYNHDRKVYEQGIGKEQRHSIGTRFYKKIGPIQFDYELTYQFGDFEQYDISAWGFASETSLLIENLDWLNEIGVRINYASGDSNSQDGELGTYNALFPNAAYVSESALFAPGNIKDIQPFANLQIAPNLTVFLGADFLWRASKDDALYVNPGVPILTSETSHHSFYGTQFNLTATWQITHFLSLQSFYTHTDVGDFIEESKGQDSEFFMTSFAVKF
ncbi:alginate export family protein [Shewanella gelidimarina]|uniref:alginate export family protein n=1 Tax=Shewanella gelidimarina TaxID=56813 RepID=UPI00200E5481|nr:alginate export family protein [Shewanella gelidimarina]MCL1057500.1 alginate export family protein [Shewanella gelidimarina]